MTSQDGMVDIKEYWSSEEHYTEINGKRVYGEVNKLGEIPITPVQIIEEVKDETV